MVLERWLNLMELWQFAANKDSFTALSQAYSGSGRFYHSHKHISACLGHLDRCQTALDYPEEVELALWFHDAVYNPLANDNEQQSANWAQKFLLANHACSAKVDRVYKLIMATKHNVAAETEDEAYLIDIDLSILGADETTYSLFEQNVRQEYKFVPKFIYNKKRAAVLADFLKRPQLYQNQPFIQEFEQQARVNLTKAIANLSR